MPRPAIAGPMSMPTAPRTVTAAMMTIRVRTTFAPSASSVPIRFWSSTADSSCAVPSVASRSMSALTIPRTDTDASRIAR